eukprot:10444169-Lingulodinium_polyedra.AAC.1
MKKGLFISDSGRQYIQDSTNMVTEWVDAISRRTSSRTTTLFWSGRDLAVRIQRFDIPVDSSFVFWTVRDLAMNILKN